jgi:hypothetical protein
VTLLSSSYDPDGFIERYRWDLDGDGAFDDASGIQVSTTLQAGTHSIGLRVTDDSGGDASTNVIIDVRPGAPGAGGGSTASAPALVGVRLLSPFPVVRVSGIVRARGIKLRVLSVNAPIGSTVNVRCAGRGCPFKRSSNVVKSQVRAAAPVAPQTGLVQVRRFARRLLRAGTIIRVFVTKPGAVGKYTRLRIRRGRLPARVDRCVTSVEVRPFPCPPG